jgi:hypothetical protein
MHTRTKIALAAMLVIGASSYATTQSIALNVDASLAAARDAAASEPLTLVASRQSVTTHVRPRQSRNAGLRNEEDGAWSGSRAPDYAPRGFPENNYQYWYQACCQ